MTVTQIQLTKVRVVIEGLPPGVIFQGKGLMSADANGKPKKPRPAEEEAKLRAHWTGRGKSRTLGIPWVMFHNSFCQAANAFDWRLPDGKKQKTKMGYMIGANLACEQECIPLGTNQFVTKMDYVRIPPKTGGMVEIGRALVPKWSVDFEILCDDEMWNVGILEEIIAHAGKAVGIGAWRPGLKGAYGKFQLTKFDIRG